MRIRIIILTILCTVLFPWLLRAGGTDSCADTGRPKIGLVLSGGGAKGSAHIGVLRVLEEAGISIDFVAGTSMGSIIGGMYALGYTPDEMDSIISSIDWQVYMSNSVTRSHLSFQDKQRKDRYLLNIPFTTAASLESSMESGHSSSDVFVSSLPAGFINGNNIENLLSSLCFGYQDSIDFNDMPIPYACVATDMVSGEEVVFRSGNLAQAIRASMAIPGVFSPVRIGDMVLVDGGMLNNFPVDVCRAMGADIVIGVRVSSKVEGNPDALNSLPKIIDQLMGTVTKTRAESNIAMCDIFIQPDVTGYGPMSFDAASIDTLISRGYEAADRQRDALNELRKRLEEYGPVSQVWNAPRAINVDRDTLTVSSVEMTGVDGKDRDWLLRKSRILKKKRMTGREIDEAVAFLYTANAFSKISYAILPDEGDSTYTVRIDLVKDVPHSFGLGFRFDSQEAAAILLGLGINEHRLTGVKFNLSARLSYNPWATATVSFVPRSFPTFNLSYTFRKEGANVLDHGRRYANVLFLAQTAKAYFSKYHSRFMTTEVGLDFDHYFYNHFLAANRGYYDVSPDDTLRSAYMGLYAMLRFDSKDRPVLATKGVDFTVRAGWKFHDFYAGSGFRTFGDLQVGFASYIPFAGSRLVLSPRIYGRFVIGDDHFLSYDNLVGGVMPGRYVAHQLPFIGANRPEIMHNSVAVLRLDLRWNVHRRHYVTAMANYAREAQGIDNMFRPAGILREGYNTAYNWWGVGLRYTYDLPLGPLDVDFSWSNLTKTFGVYVNLGYYF